MNLTPEERASGALTEETIRSAVEQIRLNGYVLFESVLPREFVDQTNTHLMNFIQSALNVSPETLEVNTKTFRTNRIRVDLPFEHPYIDERIITHPFVMPIVEAMLGADCQCFYLACDAPMPGSDYQVVHSDAPPLYQEADVSLPAAGLVVNIPLIDVHDENGPMEIWPGGTHLTPESQNTPERIQRVAAHRKPERLLTPAGSILIRDPRMWHRGTPNRSNVIRPNLALIYARSWWRGDHYSKIKSIPRSTFDSLSQRAKQLFRNIPLTQS